VTPILSTTPSAILVWNKKNQSLEPELVFGETPMRLLYETQLGFSLTESFLSKRWMSKLYGRYQSSRLSRRQIQAFIEKYKIPIEEFEPKKYISFNEFFIRRFKSDQRLFCTDNNDFSAFAEGRYLVFDKIQKEFEFKIKGLKINLATLLDNRKLSQEFLGGTLWIARLCPVDYHRFHFPDAGEIEKFYPVHGPYHSVNPIAMVKKPEILMTNERQISILKTKHFGRVAMIEVGALCVGKIVQTHYLSEPFTRGQEKGYFLFGGSTVVLLTERDAVRPDPEILEKSLQGIETLVQLGERIGTLPKNQV
jgi:phosphatidylserine decarboxylase